MTPETTRPRSRTSWHANDHHKKAEDALGCENTTRRRLDTSAATGGSVLRHILTLIGIGCCLSILSLKNVDTSYFRTIDEARTIAQVVGVVGDSSSNNPQATQARRTTTSESASVHIPFWRPSTSVNQTNVNGEIRNNNNNNNKAKNESTSSVVKPIAIPGGHAVASTSQDIQAKVRAFASLYNHSDYSKEKPNKPVKLIRFNQHQQNTTTTNNNNNKLILAIVTATRSVTAFNTSEATFLYRYLIKSIQNTVGESERAEWDIRLYIAVDDNDVWWQHHCHGLAELLPPWLQVIFGVYPKHSNHVPFNEIAATAYEDGAEYFFRVNDDTEILSYNWITTAVTRLRNYDPPNVGVTGPRCQQGNVHILTHDFVHKTHYEIFEGFYYPKAFNNWYLDDWISTVYSSKVLGDDFGSRFAILEFFKVKHWMSAQRYISSSVDAQLLPVEFQRGRQLIRKYLELHYNDTRVPDGNPKPKLVDAEYANAVEEVVPKGSNMAILVWGLGIDSHYWHDLTGGDVVFLNERTMSTNWEVKHRHLWLRATDVRYEATERGTPAAHEANYQTYVKGQTWQNNTWCDLEMAQFSNGVRDTYWNVILIAPPFSSKINETEGPGSLQALYMSQKLAVSQLIRNSNDDSETHLFVEYYERQLEHDFSNALFGKAPEEVIRVGERAYAHFVLNKKDQVVVSQASNPTKCPPPPIRDVSQWNAKHLWDTRHVSAILTALRRKGNLLIWGMSESSVKLSNATLGRVIYLDNNRTRKTEGSLERYQVRFPVEKGANLDRTALRNEWDRQKWSEMMNMTQDTHHLPLDKLLKVSWDVILLYDGHVHEYGFLQALYMSHTLARNSLVIDDGSPCHIFLLNYRGNSTGGKFANVLFGKRPSTIVLGEPRKFQSVKPIELAHFVLSTKTALQQYKELMVRQGLTEAAL